jgi:hypothetical protein
MGARNRGGRGLSYRPARLHRLAEFIPWNRYRAPYTFKNTGSWRNFPDVEPTWAKSSGSDRIRIHITGVIVGLHYKKPRTTPYNALLLDSFYFQTSVILLCSWYLLLVGSSSSTISNKSVFMWGFSHFTVYHAVTYLILVYIFMCFTDIQS